jgi:hypothetical protein
MLGLLEETQEDMRVGRLAGLRLASVSETAVGLLLRESSALAFMACNRTTSGGPSTTVESYHAA